jgi:4-aminobutyrate aminotransferase-like enzyme
MGDVHPPAVKVELLRRLVEVAPSGLERVFLANTGAEAVETALKTAALATGRPRVLAFSGGYHGLTYGALAVSGRRDFRAPFTAQLAPTAVFVPFPNPYRNPWGLDDPEAVAAVALREVEQRLFDPGAAGEGIGAVLVEPVQARGGVVVPPPSFLRGLRALCDASGALLILDEIYTGFGRTGRWFACEQAGVVPDLLVLGKALTGGLPLSAVLGTARVMDAWPPSNGEALHTSTFLGHPLGCAAALAEIDTLQRERLPERAAELGAEALGFLRTALADCPVVGDVRGLGLLLGIELVRDRAQRLPSPERVGRAVVEGLHRGLILLGGGVHRNVITLSPPLAIDADLWRWALREVVDLLRGLA